MDEKKYLSAQELLNDSFQLGIQIFKSGFRPSFIIGVWRGGTPAAIAVQEILDYLGVKTDHIAIRTSAYYGIDQRDKKIRDLTTFYLTRERKEIILKDTSLKKDAYYLMHPSISIKKDLKSYFVDTLYTGGTHFYLVKNFE